MILVTLLIIFSFSSCQQRYIFIPIETEKDEGTNDKGNASALLQDTVGQMQMSKIIDFALQWYNKNGESDLGKYFSDVDLRIETPSATDMLSADGNPINAILTMTFTNLDSDSCIPNGVVESGTLEIGLYGAENSGTATNPRYNISEYTIRTISPLVIKTDDDRMATVSIPESAGSGIAIVFKSVPSNYRLSNPNEPFNLLETLSAATELTVNGETVVVGQISALSVTITFANGENGPNAAVMSAAISIARGDSVSEPDEPQLSNILNWEFSGWFTDEACTRPYDFRTTLNEDITLYAGWKNISGLDEAFIEAGYGIAPSENGSGVVISNLSGSKSLSGEITIPSEVNGQSVTEIGREAFSGTGITSVQIPASVKTIGTSAFNGCSELTSVVLADGLTEIGDYAFYNCTELSTINIPDSVEKIGNNAFINSAFTSITLPSSLTDVGGSIFKGNEALTTVIVNGTNLMINSNMFQDCPNLTTVTLNDGVIGLEGSAFYGVTLKTLEIPASCKSIETRAFYDASIENLIINGSDHVFKADIFNDSTEIKNIVFNDYTAPVIGKIPDGSGWNDDWLIVYQNGWAGYPAFTGTSIKWSDNVVWNAAKLGDSIEETLRGNNEKEISNITMDNADSWILLLGLTSVETNEASSFKFTINLDNGNALNVILRNENAYDSSSYDDVTDEAKAFRISYEYDNQTEQESNVIWKTGVPMNYPEFGVVEQVNPKTYPIFVTYDSETITIEHDGDIVGTIGGINGAGGITSIAQKAGENGTFKALVPSMIYSSAVIE